ncbi:Parallel beta-helix repeat [Acidimicrobiia bacterium]
MSQNNPSTNRPRLGLRRTGTLLTAGSAVIAGGAPLLATSPAAADDILTVTTLNDSGTGSLREAIGLANADADQDTIVFSVSGTIALLSDLPQFDLYGATIVGEGITIDGNGAYSVFDFNDMQDRTEVHISGITIVDGQNGYGGAIRVDSDQWVERIAEISLTDVTLTGSTSTGNGGALYLYGADTISIVNSSVSGNTSGSDGGGAFIGQAGTISITGSEFSDNTASRGGGVYVNGFNSFYTEKLIVIGGSSFSINSSQYEGGGLFFDGGTGDVETVISAVMSESDVMENTSGSGGGGVFLSAGNPSSFTLNSSTISNNDSSGAGGGLYSMDAWENSIANSTITGNNAGLSGGAIFNAGGGISITDSTIAANTGGGSQDAGGVLLGGSAIGPLSIGTAVETPGQVAIFGSIIAGNSGLDIMNTDQGTPAVVATRSLIGSLGETLDFTAGTGTQIGVDPAALLLGALADNGGPTPTHALGAGSIAIDAGGDGSDMPPFNGSEFDQRGAGYARISDGFLDVGAFEVQPVVPDSTTTTAAGSSPVVPVFTG